MDPSLRAQPSSSESASWRLLPWQRTAFLAVCIGALIATFAINYQEASEKEAAMSGSDRGFSLATRTDGAWLALGQECRGGDELRLQLDGHGYVFVLTLDAEGQLGQVHPAKGRESAELGSNTVLDDAPTWTIPDEPVGKRRFIAFYSDEPMDLQTLKDTLAKPDNDGSSLAGVDVLEESCSVVDQ